MCRQSLRFGLLSRVSLRTPFVSSSPSTNPRFLCINSGLNSLVKKAWTTVVSNANGSSFFHAKCSIPTTVCLSTLRRKLLCLTF
ncbi:unnamed protein product [Schistocephalus solidus]|uniref:Secreted protein n=1 Tax=Schistocephalus solidus TaxID=70667 RepID=A0A183TU49_SCHSO|nr:unnamed protein product [Schistocephalus solidus]